MEEREITDSAAVVRFYDAVRSSTLLAAALAHGEASIGQECLLTPDEPRTWRVGPGSRRGHLVLDMGSGTGLRAICSAVRLSHRRRSYFRCRPCAGRGAGMRRQDQPSGAVSPRGYPCCRPAAGEL